MITVTIFAAIGLAFLLSKLGDSKDHKHVHLVDPDSPAGMAKRVLVIFTGLTLVVGLILNLLKSSAGQIDLTPILLLLGLLLSLALLTAVLLLCTRWAIRHLPYMQRVRFRVYLDKPKQKKGVPRLLGADGELIEVDQELEQPMKQSIEDLGITSR